MDIDELLQPKIEEQVQKEAQRLPAVPAPNLLGTALLSLVFAAGGVAIPFVGIYAWSFADEAYQQVTFIVCLVIYLVLFSLLVANLLKHYARFKTMHNPDALLSAYGEELAMLTKRKLMAKFPSKEDISEEEVLSAVSLGSKEAWKNIFRKMFFQESVLEDLKEDRSYAVSTFVAHLFGCFLLACGFGALLELSTSALGVSPETATFQHVLLTGMSMLTIAVRQILASVYDRAAFQALNVLNPPSAGVKDFLTQLSIRDVLVPMVCVGSFLTFYHVVALPA